MQKPLILAAIVILVLGLGFWWLSQGEEVSFIDDLFRPNTASTMERDGESVTNGGALQGGGSITANQPSYRTIGRNEEGIATVAYTNSGFSPFIIEVRAGESVRFVNNSANALRVTSYGHPTATDQNYPEFDSAKSIPRGEAYAFTFTRVGVWGYKNLNNDEHLGTIVVIPQNQ
jgi:plastocyanin